MSQPVSTIPVDGPTIENGLGSADLAAAEPRSLSRMLRWCGRRWAALLVAALLVLSLGAAAGVYVQQCRSDHAIDTAVRQQVLDAATRGTVSTLSYSYESFDSDLAAAKTRLTGQFLTYYSEFADQFVAPAVKQKRVKSSASIVTAAVSELQPFKAVVLLFANQVTTSTDSPDPVLANNSILVTLVRGHNDWLISEFKPI